MRGHRSFGTGRICVALLAAIAVFAGGTHAAHAAPASVSITMNPSLFPAFSPSISDYVVRCNPGSPTNVQVWTAGDAKARVDGGPLRQGRYSVAVHVNTGQEFRIQTQGGAGFGGTYHVRCLPIDFPQWTVSRPGTPQAQYYVMAPTFNTGGFAPNGHYAVVFDNHGVPVWWYYDPNGMPGDVKLLPNNHLIWTTLGANIGTGGATAQEHLLDGSIARLINAAPTAYNVGIDFHDIQLLPNGDYLIQAGYPRQDDLSAYGGPSNATIFDDVIQELTPQGSLVWQWDSRDHIDLSEVGQDWWPQILAGHNPNYDPFHMNSIQEYGDNIVISFRHLNAVYEISRSTGQILWKLGGSGRSPSAPGIQLHVMNDPVFDCGSNFSGQHNARMLSDGTITLHDNGSTQKTCGTNVQRPPRGVRYLIDLNAGTATLLEQVNDPAAAPKSGCCGSALKLGPNASDDWVADWGITNTTDELTSAGAIVFQLQWVGKFSYRTFPVLPGVLAVQALRDGMNAQFPR